MEVSDGGRDAGQGAATAADRELARALLESDGVRRAVAYLETTDERTLAEQTELTEIPAPPFGETVRGRRMAGLMRESGLESVEVDEEGNVVGRAPASGGDGAPLVVAAHLDTVFPPDTDVRVTRSGSKLCAPGIADDGRGLAALLALVRALDAGGLRLSRPLLAVATVGEEGVGDLRGVRHLFGEGGAGRGAHGFVSLDGAGLDRVVREGLGSRRFRVTITGPGGHSWSDWGAPNPLHALGDAIALLTSIQRPEGTTLSVGRAEGGRSVNAIPESAWMELETRSTSDAELARMEAEIRAAILAGLERHPDARPGGGESLEVEIERIGDRPGGGTPVDHPLVRAALAATTAHRADATLVASSTDANVPMSLGLPAITLGAGGTMGRAHTVHEWYDNTDGVVGIGRALLTLLVYDALTRDA